MLRSADDNPEDSDERSVHPCHAAGELQRALDGWAPTYGVIVIEPREGSLQALAHVAEFWSWNEFLRALTSPAMLAMPAGNPRVHGLVVVQSRDASRLEGWLERRIDPVRRRAIWALQAVPSCEKVARYAAYSRLSPGARLVEEELLRLGVYGPTVPDPDDVAPFAYDPQGPNQEDGSPLDDGIDGKRVDPFDEGRDSDLGF